MTTVKGSSPQGGLRATVKAVVAAFSGRIDEEQLRTVRAIVDVLRYRHGATYDDIQALFAGHGMRPDQFEGLMQDIDNLEPHLDD